MQPIKDETGKPIDLSVIVENVARELIEEKKRESSNLIKNLFKKVDDITYQVKTKKRELEKLQMTLSITLEKIERLRKGDWSVLVENTKQTKVDSSQEQEETEKRPDF